MGLQATLLTSAALTAEVNALKQNLERSENELGRAKNNSRTKKVSSTLLKLYLTEKDLVARRMTRITWVLQGPRTRWRP